MSNSSRKLKKKRQYDIKIEKGEEKNKQQVLFERLSTAYGKLDKELLKPEYYLLLQAIDWGEVSTGLASAIVKTPGTLSYQKMSEICTDFRPLELKCRVGVISGWHLGETSQCYLWKHPTKREVFKIMYNNDVATISDGTGVFRDLVIVPLAADMRKWPANVMARYIRVKYWDLNQNYPGSSMKMSGLDFNHVSTSTLVQIRRSNPYPSHAQRSREKQKSFSRKLKELSEGLNTVAVDIVD